MSHPKGHTGSHPILRLFVIVTILCLATACGGGNGSSKSKSGSGLPVAVSGVVLYEDRTFDGTGFTGTIGLPVRHAIIEVVRSSDQKVLAEDSTREDGTYSLTFTNDGSSGVYVSVLAQDSDGRVRVVDKSHALYSADMPELDDSAADQFDVPVTIPVNNGGGIFNMLDVFLHGAESGQSLTGEAPPLVTAVWSSGNCDGTYFAPIDDSIHVYGGCAGDTDEYDDVVLLHEYGHFLGDTYSRDDSPGGEHILGDNGQDIRVAFSEGWGDFFPAAVRNDPLYVDTVGSVAAFSFSLEDLGSVFPDLSFLPVSSVYTTNEISVAAALWDIFDTSPQEILSPGPDSVSEGMGPIWDVFSNYLSCLTCSISNVSFEDFWDGWFIRGHGLSIGMEVIAGDREMALSADAFEGDDALASAAAIGTDGSAQTHTLYPLNDTDYLKFDANAGTTYTIETLDLTNGADTVIDLLDSSGSVLQTNDNFDGKSYSVSCAFTPAGCPENGPLTLSSRLTFLPSMGGTYFVRVRRSTAAPPSAGTYGAYKVRIRVP